MNENTVEIVELPERIKKELEEIYLRRKLRKCDDRISELEKGLFWLNVAEWTFYSLIAIVVSIHVFGILFFIYVENVLK